MKNFDISTELMSSQGVIPRRRVRINGKEFATPARATPIEHTRDGEAPLQECKQICEIHQEIDSERLATERQGKRTPITDSLRRAANKTEEDDVAVVFLTYTDTSPLAPYEAEQVVDLLVEFSDFVTVPLIPNLKRMVQKEDGVDDEAFQHYAETAQRVIEVARESYSSVPIMGTVPMLGRVHVTDLFQMYLGYDIRAFCVNFDGGQASASTKVNLLRPLMRDIGRRDLELAILMYAINLKSGHQDEDLGGAPADDVGAVGLGFDVLGENHVGIRAPPEVIEEMAEKESDQETFTLFDRNRFVHEDVPLAHLPEEFPEESNFDPQRVVRRAQGNDNHRRRLEKLITAEQIALALTELQDTDRDAVFRELAERPGISTRTISAAQELREELDSGMDQSGLDEWM